MASIAMSPPFPGPHQRPRGLHLAKAQRLRHKARKIRIQRLTQPHAVAPKEQTRPGQRKEDHHAGKEITQPSKKWVKPSR